MHVVLSVKLREVEIHLPVSYGRQQICLRPLSAEYRDGVIKWKHFPRYWSFVRGIHRSPVNSTHKDQWRRALIFSMIYARINGLVNNREAGDLRHYLAHYDVIVMMMRMTDG